MSTQTLWIIAPVRDASRDISAFLASVTGNFVAPETYEVSGGMVQEEPELLPYPYFGQTPPNFSGRVVLVAPEGYPSYDGTITLHRTGERPNISADWNEGAAYAQESGATHVLFLNGPNSLDPFAVRDALNSIQNGFVNMADGAAFMFEINAYPQADEQFRIWFADNDLFKRVTDGGAFRPGWSRINDQIDPEPIIHEIVTEDQERFSAKYAN